MGDSFGPQSNVDRPRHWCEEDERRRRRHDQVAPELIRAGDDVQRPDFDTGEEREDEAQGAEQCARTKRPSRFLDVARCLMRPAITRTCRPSASASTGTI